MENMSKNNKNSTLIIMKDALNNGLIKAMREHLPEETNLANYIMDIISIGKEAVYRRLRGGSSVYFL